MAVPAEKRLSRQSLSAQMAERLREEITNGAYMPGALLPSELSLSTEYGVSRPVVREAFKLLNAQGYVQPANGRGTIVREINDEPLRVFFQRLIGKSGDASISNLFQIRDALEGMSAVLAAENRTPQDLQQLGKTLERMEESIGDPDTYIALDMQFHVQLAHASCNTFLCHLITSIRSTLVPTMKSIRHALRASHLAAVHQHHVRVLAAVTHRNPSGAQKAMEHHNDSVMDRMPRAMRWKKLP